MLLLNRFDPTDAASDDDACAQAINLLEVDRSVFHRRNRCGNTKLRKTIKSLGFAGIDSVASNIERRAFTAKANGVLTHIPTGDRTDAALSSTQRIPHPLDVFAERCDDTQAGNDYATRHGRLKAVGRMPDCESGDRQPKLTHAYFLCSLM